LRGEPWWVVNGVPRPLPPLSTSWLNDQRAIASGRRRSSLADWRAARAAEQGRQRRNARLRRAVADG
jgi:hypothetical protein